MNREDKTIAVHQPQYLPWLGYFDKMSSAGQFVFLDCVQYKRREYQNRNRIRTPDGWTWLTVPVLSSGEYSSQLKDIRINNTFDWRRKHWASISQHYGQARHFSDYADEWACLYEQQWEWLIDLNLKTIEILCRQLEVTAACVRESEVGTNSKSTERIIEICRKLDGTRYLSGAGGRDYMDEPAFDRAGIGLAYQEYDHPKYEQAYPGFEPYMSAIDYVFNVGALR